MAHQGGWDEALLVAVPMVLVAWLLWLAKVRVNRAEKTRAARDDGSPTNLVVDSPGSRDGRQPDRRVGRRTTR